MVYKYKRIKVLSLAVAVICTNVGGGLQAFGAEAKVDVDETVYVNLDYYGKVDMVNVVKGCNLNGLNEFTDYGTYMGVTNMSSEDSPVLGDETVTWNLPETHRGRFYYECEMDKSQVILPWDFDVSYKLNGVPIDADKLAGASGTVEIHVEAKPNDNALEYYRNNMILMVAVPVDYDDCYSVEAEGSQTQNFGSVTAVAFTALPGEEGDYTVRIGSDSFENIGVIMMMTPGTVEDLEHVADLKEAKDTWKGAGDELYDSMDQMAASVEAMRNGVNQALQGLDSADRARQKWSNSKDSILAGNDQALASLTSVSQQMELMIPHIQTAKDSAEVVHNSMGDVVDTLGQMQDPLRKLNTRLRNIKSDTSSISEQIPELTELMQHLIALDTVLQASEQLYVTKLGIVGDNLSLIGDDYYMEEEEAQDSQDEGSDQNAEESGSAESGDESGVNAKESSQEDESQSSSQDETKTSSRERAFNEDSTELAASITKHNVPFVSAAGSSKMGAALDTEQLMGVLTQKGKVLGSFSKTSSELSSLMSSLMEETSDSAKYSAELVDSLDYLIEDLTALDDSLNIYYPDFQASLDDTKELVNRTTSAMNDGISTMTIIQNTLKASSDDFDAAARDGIKANMELLDKSLNILDSTTSMRHAGRTMKDTIDDEWDDLDTDNRFLFMDPEADKVSFTSGKNSSPKTLQIVLRTNEINLDDDDQITDAEVEEEGTGPLQRMWNVLVEMCKAIANVFKNR